MAKKWVKKQIEKMRTLAFTEIPQRIKSTPGMSLEAYLEECRLTFNTIIVGALTGGEFTEGKKNKDGDKTVKIKFDHKLPDKNELAEIAEIVNGYIGQVENPFLQRFVMNQQPASEGDEDMSIPDQEGYAVSVGSNVPKIEKISKKKLENYIFGKDGKPSLCKMLLTSIDCISIAALGEDLRKKENRNKMLIIGGIALVLTGAAIAGVCVYNHRRKGGSVDDMLDDIGVDEITTDISDDDAPIVSIIA